MDLVRKMTPPAKPFASSGDWKATEATLHSALPEDYKAFIGRYGAGNVGDFIHVWSPFTDKPNLGFVAESKKHLDSLRALRHAKIPYPLHPNKGGLLPWGRTDNSDILMWRTSGPPAKWTVVITDGSDFYDTELGFGEFLSRFLDKTLGSPAFPDDVPVAGPRFFPAT